MSDHKGQYVNFAFYQVDPAWRRLPAAEREQGRAAFAAALHESGEGVLLRAYSLVGIRADADLMLWRISADLDALQRQASAYLSTPLGAYLRPAYSYLALGKRSVYVDRLNPEHEGKRQYIQPGSHKYLFVYPFVKTRDWYHLTLPARQGMMNEHITVGNKYPSVKLNTTYSFGLDDQEFVVAFESDEPADFLDLVMELRESEASRYTLRDTPTFTCLHRSLAEAMASLG
ncbi:MAG: chlorite dismutase family protein [Symbiobacteriia bacterium]